MVGFLCVTLGNGVRPRAGLPTGLLQLFPSADGYGSEFQPPGIGPQAVVLVSMYQGATHFVGTSFDHSQM